MNAKLIELAALFLRLGTTAFGGPAAHIAMMEAEVVRRRRWLDEQELLDLIGATNLIPGPSSTELAIHIGHRRAGWAGLLVAGTCFILPAAAITAALAYAYTRWGQLPAAEGLLYGVKPVIIAIVAQALLGLAPKAARSRPLIALGLAAVAAGFAGADEIALILGAGAIALAAAALKGGPPPDGGARVDSPKEASPTRPAGPPATDNGASRKHAALPGRGSRAATFAARTPATLRSGLARIADAATFAPRTPGTLRSGLARVAAGATAAAWAAPAAAATAAAPAAGSLFLLFAKIGSVLFGSGYVLLAFLRADLVERLGWMTEQQLLDAVAAGQVTPGPVFTTATFIGWVLGGPAGAAAATGGIFAPAFFFVALSGPLVPRLRRSRLAGAFLDGVNVASLALMFVVTVNIARAALVDPLTIALAIASAIVLFRYKPNPSWVVLAGASAGLISAAI